MGAKSRFSFMIDQEALQRLRDIQRRTGLSVAEQVREGIRWWLRAREWPEEDRPDGPKRRRVMG